MARKVIGPTGSRRRRWLLLFSLVLTVTAAALFIPSAFAVHDVGLFQLDRNATATEAGHGPGDDWATLYNSGGNNGCLIAHDCLDFSGVVPDVTGSNPLGSTGTQFQGGGSKDNNDITQWLWNPGEPLDKDDITNAYAAAYSYQGSSEVCTPPAQCVKHGDMIVYYGLDRFANNGTAQVGFWFLKDPGVGLTTTASQGGYKFAGTHQVGDLLVQSNFTGGGVITSITVYKWVGSGGSNGALDQLYAAVDCNPPSGTLSNDVACATVNQGDTSSPWPYTPKAGTAGTFPAGSFFEGGIDITQLVPDAGCFSKFVAETRSSAPFDSRLKDFALGNFSLCAAKISITPDGTNQVGNDHTFTVSVQKKDSSNGFTYGPADGVTVTGTKTDSNGATSSWVGGDSCTTDATGTCTLTITSPTPGQTSVSASADVDFANDGSTTVTTDGTGDNSGPAVKTWVDARISIGDSGTNKVGDPHTFTVTTEQNAGDGNGWVPASGVSITPSETGVGDITGGTCGSQDTDSNGQCTIIVSSSSTGSSTVNASGTVTVGGVPIDVATDGYGAFNVSNTKTWVDARISIGTSGTNKVGDSHTFTVTVEKDAGDGSGFVAASGVTVSPTTDFGSITGGTCTTTTTNGSGQCTIIVNSNDPGTATVNASATVTVGGIDIDVATDGYGAFNISNTKTWVDARISIGDSGTNQVGQEHTFTVTVEQNDGSGWSPAADVAVSSSTDFGTITGGTCTSGNTDANGQCTIIVNSNDPGTATVDASATVTVGGVDIDVATDGYGAFNISNTKTWVDARISIEASATNGITEPHTFTVTVEQNDGSGWSPAQGVTVTPSTDFGTITGGTCTTTTTDSNGQCTIDVNSSDPGTATVNASATVTVSGVDIDVATDGYGSFTVDNQKTWVAGSLTWIKHDNNGALLGGATFQVCATGGTAFGLTPTCVSVTDNSPPDVDPVAGQFELDTYQVDSGFNPLGGLAMGTYSIAETSPPPGYTGDSHVEFVTLTTDNPNGSSTYIWVNTPPQQGCTPGFWQGGLGSTLWNTTNDPQWASHGGAGTNPFTTTTPFDSFFTPYHGTSLGTTAGKTMLDFVGSGGGPKPAEKAARMVVAAYLNAAFGLDFPYSTSDIVSMWNAAVAAHTSASFTNVFNLLGAANNLGCPIS